MTSPETSETLSHGRVRHTAILGNVCVGKTSLFSRLCVEGDQAANIPGSTLTVKRGVLAAGPDAAPRAYRRRCASCSIGRGLRFEDLDACLSDDPHTDAPRCPVVVHTRSEELGTATITHVYDTPGSATLAANSEDEMAARDLILSGHVDSLLLVADAKNLRRSLALVLETAELGLPMVLVLNMTDEAEGQGLEIDEAALSRILSVPVVSTVAVDNRGVRQLAATLPRAHVPQRPAQFPEAIRDGLAQLEQLLANPEISSRALGILILCGDHGAKDWVAQRLGRRVLHSALAVAEKAQSHSKTPLRQLLADCLYAEAGRIVDRVVVQRRRGTGRLARFGALAQQPLWGTLIAIAVLGLAYLWVGAFAATFVVDKLSAHLFDGFLNPLLERVVAVIPSEFIQKAIMDPTFGLLPTGLFLAVGIVLPVLFCFYLFQAVLEDSGYMPRLAVLSDRLFRPVGLNGQGLIPLVLGFSCVAAAVISNRMLPTRKERILLTLLVVGVPCAPLLAVMIVILGKLPWTAAAVVFGVITLRLLAAGFVTSRVLGNTRSDFILEIPPMRIPRPRVLIAKTWRRTWEFIREAVPVFLVAAFVLFLFDQAGGLHALAEVTRPFVESILGLPDQAVHVFIKTVIRREAGAAELSLLQNQFSGLQLVISLITMTLLFPCVNTAVVILKERGGRATLVILGTAMVSAILVGAVVNLICRGLGVTFT